MKLEIFDALIVKTESSLKVVLRYRRLESTDRRWYGHRSSVLVVVSLCLLIDRELIEV